MKRNAIILLIVFAVLAVLMLLKKTDYTNQAYLNLKNQPICSEEAKICPDGSSVYRTGSDCSFSACPKPIVKNQEKSENTDTDAKTEPVTLGSGEEKTDDSQVVFCTMEAKMCSDGTYVGRIGPDCEFAACPAEKPKDVNQAPSLPANVSEHDLGQTKENNGVLITPVSIKEDSRCKEGMQCIWAGRLILVTRLEQSSGTKSGSTTPGPLERFIQKDIELELNVSYIYEGKTVTLIDGKEGKFYFEVK